jgi:hypothetical protein
VPKCEIRKETIDFPVGKELRSCKRTSNVNERFVTVVSSVSLVDRELVGKSYSREPCFSRSPRS